MMYDANYSFKLTQMKMLINLFACRKKSAWDNEFYENEVFGHQINLKTNNKLKELHTPETAKYG